MAEPRETPPPTPAADRRSFGVLIFCVGMLMFCIGDAFGKHMTVEGVPIVMVVWARYAGSLAFLVALMPFMGWRRVAGTARIPIQLARGAVVVCATTLFFAGLQFMTMADATGINFVSPLFVAAMAAMFLGEHVGAKRWTAIGVGMLGVVVIARPGLLGLPGGSGGGGLGWAALLMVGSSLAFSVYQILSRIVGRTDSPVVSVFWALFVGAIIVTLLVPFHWTALDARLWGVFFAHGLFACLGHLLLVTSYRYAPAAHLAPFYYVQLIWSSLVGWVGFGEVPGTATLVGAALLAATGLFVARIKD